MKKIIFTITFLATFASINMAHARKFYQTSFKIKIQYSHIDTGLENLAQEYPVKVRYSDDNDFCVMNAGGIEYSCTSYVDDYQKYEAHIAFSNSEAQKLLYNVLSQTLKEQECNDVYKCTQITRNYLIKLERLLANLEGYIELEHHSYNRDFHQQLHDEQPESFELYISSLTRGEIY